MPALDEKQKSATSWKVSVAGANVEPGTLSLAVVEDSVHLPDTCILTYQDQGHDVIGKGGFEIGKELAIKSFDEGNTSGKELFKGEITALEASFENGKSFTTIRA